MFLLLQIDIFIDIFKTNKTLRPCLTDHISFSYSSVFYRTYSTNFIKQGKIT